MCKCTPNIRTPYCGIGDCVWSDKELIMSKKQTKRFNLTMSQDMFEKIEAIANEQHSSTVEVMRQFIRVGLMAYSAQNNPDEALIIKRDGKSTELFLV